MNANTPATYMTDMYAFNHAQRQAYQTDWAFTAFVVDSSDDPDGRFADNYFAYAYQGGQFLVMSLDNGSWGSSNMGYVFAHEMARIFYALNEFTSQDPYSKHNGYYDTQNWNAATSILCPIGIRGIAAKSSRSIRSFRFSNALTTETG